MLGLLGLLVFLAGVHLCWQAREAVFYWLRFLVLTWRAALGRSQGSVAYREGTARHTLRMVGGFGLVFLGQLLVALDFFVF